jgi:glycosyltransferase involved in cell wall biosynthesis
MKILLVTPMPPRPQAPGAIPLVLYAELIGLMECHQVSLITVAGLEPGEEEAVEQLRLLQIPLYVAWRKKVHGIKKWRRRWRMASAWLAGKIPWRTIWFWEPELQNILNNLLANNDYDLIIVEDNAMGIYTYRSSFPLFFTEHEVRRPRSINWAGLRQKKILQWAFSELDWMRWRRYQANTWKKFDRIQTFSDRDADAIRSLQPELTPRVQVNPFGIALPVPADPTRQDDKIILFVGNFTHPPNVDAALWLDREIMPVLRNLCPRVSLVLIGIYPPREILRIAKGDIRVIGPVNDIEPFFEQAAVVVAPIRTGGGMRMKVLHAMAMGKAVVTTPRGAAGLAVDGISTPVIVADEADNFARAIADLLTNREKRIELGSQARNFVEAHFSAQAYARRIETIYEEMKARQ